MNTAKAKSFSRTDEEPPAASRDRRGPSPAAVEALRPSAEFAAWPSTSVIIPTLNEARNLAVLLPHMPKWVHEVIIIDGHSVDDTVATAKALLPNVKVVICTQRGKGAAIRAGFAAATGDVIVMMDADGSMDPDEIITFVAALAAGADFVKGSRFLQGGGTDDMSLLRFCGNWGLTWLVRMLYGGRFTDLCYGYIAFWRRHLPLFASDADGFEIETLLNLRAIKGRLRVAEVASFEYDRIYGSSNLRAVPDGFRVLRTIQREKFRRAAPEMTPSKARTV